MQLNDYKLTLIKYINVFFCLDRKIRKPCFKKIEPFNYYWQWATNGTPKCFLWNDNYFE